MFNCFSVVGIYSVVSLCERKANLWFAFLCMLGLLEYIVLGGCMDIRKIYLDMDGVLADFDRGVIELLGITPHPQGESTKEEDDYLYFKMQEVPHFYELLEPMDGAVEMFRTLYEKYGDRVEILTGIPKPKRGIIYAGEDKLKWVKKYLSDDLVVNIVLRKDKILFSNGPGDILIDDFSVNINEWEEAGGTGIIHTSPRETMNIIRELENR